MVVGGGPLWAGTVSAPVFLIPLVPPATLEGRLVIAPTAQMRKTEALEGG